MSNWICLFVKFVITGKLKSLGLNSRIIHEIEGDLEIPLIASKALSIGLFLETLPILLATSLMSLSLNSPEPAAFFFSYGFR